ncbi:Curli biogenesis system outer membrane secretion channel CsgG [Persephonella hydrogeniphila]|uniref:Curli biogenesis system outer membrane secretion channel CsgG n=1 Tax=Persephonella hydrogeniphila TaxID=198703 RepID=A0A285NFU8_9AQUI|nr:CsgG/HfaB family protein [Persephonella hydrogeniphila]SNZ06756.1 Curli biogenesis system outer membrane secretion channel CsgG [Persephonella hydrogeniphila]
MRSWKWIGGFLLLFVFFYISGCAGVSTTSVQTTEQSFNEPVKYEGPKARIAVANFKCKAAKCGGRIGSGIRDMLVDALVRTGKFIVLERGEGLEEIKKELELGQSGLVQPGKAPQPGLLEGADILVVGSIVAFEPNAGGIKGGVGGLIPKIPLIGGVKLGKEDAYIALTLRFIDVRTGRIINSTRVEGKASSFSIGGLGGGILGTIPLGGGLEVYKNTPMEKAVMVLIDNAVKAIEKYVPESYYRYKGSEAPTQAKPVATAPSEQTTQVATPATPATQPEGKLIFSEDFESYGIGQTPPIGDFTGNNASVATVVDANKRITKAVVLRGSGKICNKNLKLKNLILEADYSVVHNYCDAGYIYLRVRENPIIAYRLHLTGCGKFSVDKVAGNSSVQIASVQVKDIKPVNNWTHVKVIMNNSNLKIYANGRLVIDINDNDPGMSTAGYICFGRRLEDVHYDNIKVYSLD